MIGLTNIVSSKRLPPCKLGNFDEKNRPTFSRPAPPKVGVRQTKHSCAAFVFFFFSADVAVFSHQGSYAFQKGVGG